MTVSTGYNRELPGFPRYSVLGTDESGVFNLQILNATLEDEAEYECQVGQSSRSESQGFGSASFSCGSGLAFRVFQTFADPVPDPGFEILADTDPDPELDLFKN